MKPLFQWLDSHPGVYFPLATAASFIFLLWLVRERQRHGNNSRTAGDLVAGGLMLIMLLAWRWPYLLDPNPLNPDEAHLLTGALTLWHHPADWIRLDTHTAGILDPMALLILRATGVPLDYFGARLTGLLMVWLALCLCYDALRSQHGSLVATLGFLPVLLFFCLTQDGDLLHYSSEHLPVLLSSVAGWALTRARLVTRQTRLSPQSYWLLTGVAAGLLPWAKFQAVPLAVVFLAWGCLLVWQQPQHTARWRLKYGAALLAAAAAPAAVILTSAIAAGQISHLYQSYVLNNLSYTAAPMSLMGGLSNLVRLSRQTNGVPAFLAGPLLLILAGSFPVWRNPQKEHRWFWTGLALTAVALAMILLPRRGFQHYLLFLPLPITWWSTAALGELFRHHVRWNPHRWLIVLLILVFGLGLQIAVRATRPPPPTFGRFLRDWRYPYDDAGLFLRYLRQPGDCLAVWGWDCHLYVETGLPQATREAHTEHQIRPHPQRDSYYLPRYLDDLRQARPAFFVDVVGSGSFEFTDRCSQAHESVPELVRYIAAEYVYIGDFHSARVYLRRDRADRATVHAARDRMESRRLPFEYRPEPPVETIVIPGLPGRNFDGMAVSMMLPPSSFSWPLVGDERVFVFDYGYDPKAYVSQDQGNGTELSVSLESPGLARRVLFHRLIDPAHQLADQGNLTARVALPAFRDGSRLIVETSPGLYNDTAWDWAYVARLRFYRSPALSEAFR